MSDPAPQELLREIDVLTAEVAAGRRSPYETANEISGLAARGMVDDSTCSSLFLIWAALTDGFEVGGQTLEEANFEMVRFATEWAKVSREGGGVESLLHRWTYDELGYKDKPHKSEAESERDRELDAVRQRYAKCRCDVLVQVPEQSDIEDARVAVEAYSDPRHMTWEDDRVYRCQHTSWTWEMSLGGHRIERAGK